MKQSKGKPYWYPFPPCPFPDSLGPPKSSSREEAKGRQVLREQLAQELYYMQLVPSIGYDTFLAADSLVIRFAKTIRSFTRSPFQMATFDRMIDDYFEHHDPHGDHELVYVLENLTPKEGPKTGQRVIDWVAAAALFIVGTYIGEAIGALYVKITSDGDEDEDEEKARYLSGGAMSFKEGALAPVIELDSVIETFKRAVARPDYQLLMRMYGPALARALDEDSDASREFEELLNRPIQRSRRREELERVAITITIAIISLGAGVIVGLTKYLCENLDEEDEEDEKE